MCRENSNSTLLNQILSLSKNLPPSTQESKENKKKNTNPFALLSNFYDRFNATSQTWEAKDDKETFKKFKSFFDALDKNNSPTPNINPSYGSNPLSIEDRRETTQHFNQQFKQQSLISFEKQNKSLNTTELNTHHLPSHVWIVVLVNVIIVLSAVCIAACCCSSRGLSYTTAPYSALPKAQSHHYCESCIFRTSNIIFCWSYKILINDFFIKLDKKFPKNLILA